MKHIIYKLRSAGVIKIIIIFLFIAFTSCEEKKYADADSKKSPLKQTVDGANTMQPKLYKGMYYFLPDEGAFTDCDSKKKYLLSINNENANLQSVYSLITNYRKPIKKLYIEAEGFTSVQSKQEGKGFDSVMIITKCIKLDTAINCEK
ncbi:MAG: hypothetical protein M3R36_10250 [Bacteroidota bacterium]|nr:hypothetical protein [Bacteroidota bacterium]